MLNSRKVFGLLEVSQNWPIEDVFSLSSVNISNANIDRELLPSNYVFEFVDRCSFRWILRTIIPPWTWKRFAFNYVMLEDDLWKHEELHERADRPDRSIVKEKVGIDKEPFNFLKCKTKCKDKNSRFSRYVTCKSCSYLSINFMGVFFTEGQYLWHLIWQYRKEQKTVKVDSNNISKMVKTPASSIFNKI